MTTLDYNVAKDTAVRNIAKDAKTAFSKQMLTQSLLSKQPGAPSQTAVQPMTQTTGFGRTR